MKSTSGTRKPYTGSSRSLVLALDVGTTFSGVSYAILEPGEVPKIHGVTRFPGQEHVAGNSKIPSIMYYDASGEMKAAGAEAEGASLVATAEDEGWIKTELFKLRLRPKSMKLKMNGMRLAPLPHGKTAVNVFGDFLSYLFRCTRSFIIDTHANGHALWRAVEHDIQFVLSHPNGWEGAQQSKMRRAATYGNLIPDTDEGKARIRFVTEGEASLHACVLNGLAADVLQNPSGHGFIVADAGGGTLDISSYAIRGTAPLIIEEIAPPDCVFAGSVFVSRRARAFFEEKLKSSKYGTPDSLDHITKRFDETTKRLFRNKKELQFVPFGSPLDKDLQVGIRAGQLKLTGSEVAALFEPSIEAAVQSIKAQIDSSHGTIKSVWLVGGFAASPWLFSQLQDRLARYHVVVSRPDTQTSKAVADGAIGFYCDHHVSARISKFMYGVEYLRDFDPKDEEHVARKHRLFEMPSGPKFLPDAFDCILARGVKVKESNVFSRKYCTEITSMSTLSVFEVEIWCYRGGDTIPKWIHRSSDVFSTLCYVRADLSPLAGSAQAKEGRGGKTYWTIVFSIEIHFGLTEFKARIKWVDNGKTRYGPASIVYNESGHRAEEEEPDSSPEDNVTVLSSPSDRGPSRSASQPPSRDPSMRSGRPSAYASPRIPSQPVEPVVNSRGFEVERQRTASILSSASKAERTRTTSISSNMSKGKAREIYASGAQTPRSGPPAAEPMRSSDRSINVSGRSAESGRSGSTRLGEELNAVWGKAPSVPSPLAENPPFNGHSRQSSRRETKPPTPRAVTPEKEYTPPNMSKQPTPPTASSLQTPVITPPPLGPYEPIVPRPPSVVSYATPTPSKPPTPPPIEPVTPTRATPAASKIPTPTSGSKAATPAWGSKAATPVWGSKAATPAWGSKVPTPAATSKAATPRALSKAATPRAVTPRAITPPPAEPIPVPAPAEPVPAFEPEAAAPPVEAHGLTSSLFADPAPIIYPTGTVDDGEDVVPPVPGDIPLDDIPPPHGADVGAGPAPPGAMSPMADLWNTPVPEPAPPTSTGLFSNFLSGPSWNGAASKLGFGGFGGGGSAGNDDGNGNNASSGGGVGFGSFGNFGWGGDGSNSNDNAAADEAKWKQEQGEEELRLRQEAEERARFEAEEAERKRLEEEEAARKAAEEEEKRKAGGKTPKKMTKRQQMLADKKAKEEEERKTREEEETAAKLAKEAEEAALKAAEEETAAKWAEEEAEAAKRAAEEAEAATEKAEEEAAEAAKRAAEEAEEAQKAVEVAAAAAATATTPAEVAVAAELAAEAQEAQADADAAAQTAAQEAAEAKLAEEAEEAAKNAAAEAEVAAENAEGRAEDAEDEAKRALEEAQKAMEEEWSTPITVKGKKGKKGGANAAATPDPLSRQTSEAPDANGFQKGKKKKGKK